MTRAMKTKKRPSGVSAGIKNTFIYLETSNYLEVAKPSPFTIKIANTLEEREAVFRLGYQIYLEKGYIDENPQKWLVRDFDANPETVILIVKDKEEKVVGSLTLVFDGSLRLPVEKTYGEEIECLRNQKEKIVEVTRLIIDPEFRNSKEILVLLINYLYVYSYHIKKYSCFAVEVNPRHVAYYQGLMHFKKIGDLKECADVKNAPAVLLYLPLQYMHEEVLKLSTDNEAFSSTKRSLYKSFAKANQESMIASYLQKQVRPISEEEMSYFGFAESGTMKAVLI